MTAYFGGKQRMGEHIARVIADVYDECRDKVRGYCEPFCGMCGVYRYIPEIMAPNTTYKAGDTNKSLILMWQSILKGRKINPAKVTASRYRELQATTGRSSAERGFIGHLFGYYGQYFQGININTNPNMIRNNIQRVYDIGSAIKNTMFSHGDYTQFSNLTGYIIYCDPPYKNTCCKYYTDGNIKHSSKFNHDTFWTWCLKMAKNNIVLVSEFSAPKHKNIRCIYKHGRERVFLVV